MMHPLGTTRPRNNSSADPPALAKLVIGDKVRPQWIDGGARFWYTVSNGVGRRFVLVDPAAGEPRAGLRPRPAGRHAHRGLRATGRP